MIISNAHKFIFIKTNKTAGSSFEGLLSHYLKAGDWVTKAQREEEEYRTAALKGAKVQYFDGKGAPQGRIIKQHARLLTAQKRFPESKNFLSFGVLRNPFDRVISSFRWRKQGYIKRILNEDLDLERKQKILKDRFLEYIIYDQGDLNARGINLLFGVDRRGNSWSVDYIFKLENLKKAKSILRAQLGLKIDLEQMPRFKENTIKLPPEVNLWDTKTIRAATNMFSWEFSNLGYPANPVSLQ